MTLSVLQFLLQLFFPLMVTGTQNKGIQVLLIIKVDVNTLLIMKMI